MKLSRKAFLCGIVFCAASFATAQTPAPTATAKKESGFVWSDKDIDDVENRRMIQAKKALEKMADDLKASTPEHRDTKEYVDEYTRFAFLIESEVKKPSWKDSSSPDFGKIPPPSEAAFAAFEAWAKEEIKARKEAAEKAAREYEQQLQLEAEQQQQQAAENATQNPAQPATGTTPAADDPEKKAAENAKAKQDSLNLLEWQTQQLSKKP